MNTKFQMLFFHAKDLVRTSPLILLMSLIAGISSVVAIENEKESWAFSYTVLAFVACLGISLFFALKMAAERYSKKVLLYSIGFLTLVGLYFFLPKTEKEFGPPDAFLLAGLFLLSHLLVSFVAYLQEKESKSFWFYNKQLFLNVFLTGVFTFVLVGGVMLALLSVDKLFELNFDDSLYPKIFLFLSITGSTFIFLLFGSGGIQELEKPTPYPPALKFFTQLILIPLLLIYVVILYLYASKILIQWELPRGWVSYLILIYACVGQLALLLVHPLKNDLAKSWVKIFSRIFYFSLIPLLVLLFVALFTRILEYGYTEPRYFLLILSLWLTSVVGYFCIKENASIKFIPLSLFAFGAFALFMPYLNAFSSAKRSQISELEKELSEAKVLKEGKIQFDHKISDTQSESIADKFHFLAQRGEWASVSKWVPKKQIEILSPEVAESQYWNFKSKLKHQFTNVSNTKPNDLEKSFTLDIEPQLVKTSGFDYAYSFKVPTQVSLPLEKDQLDISYSPYANSPSLLFTLKLENGKTVSKDLLPTLQNLAQPYKNQGGTISSGPISSEFSLADYKFELHFQTLSARATGTKGSEWVLDPLQFTILIRKN
ncbi:DUF4153 domain-containing protein [Chryseobacterium sp. A321]